MQTHKKMKKLAKAYQAAAYILSGCIMFFAGKLIERGPLYLIAPFLLTCLMLAVGEGLERKGGAGRATAYIGALKGLIEKMKMADAQREIWDFSREKAQPVFVQDDAIMIRPVN